MAVLRNRREILLGGFIRAAHVKGVQEDLVMEPAEDYVIAPDGEIVKVKEGNYEYTGMYVVD
jgi:hypothetical protein